MQWVTLAAAGTLMLALLIPVGLGLYMGSQDRSELLHQKAVEHFQSGLAYESEQYTELAIAELQIALKFDPSYQEAQAKLSQLQGGANRTPVPNDTAIADQLFQRAQGFIDKKQWDDAINSLEELQRAKADYRPDQVTSMLVTCYLNSGKQSITSGDIEEAKSHFDAALNLDPNNTDVKTLDARAALYVDGLRAAGSDWPTAVLDLQQLYQQDPNFYDVKKQYIAALVGYGDYAVQNSPCVAAREYDRAVALGGGSGAPAKLADANARCRLAVTVPTATPTAPPGAQTPPAGGHFTGQSSEDRGASCQGTGGITGTIRDAQGNPLAGIKIRIYNDYDYKPPLFTSKPDGSYVIILGKDAAVFHVLIVNPDGSANSPVVDVNYPGGGAKGCHWVVDWTRNQ